MMGRVVLLVAILATLGVLAGAGAAYGWSGGGNNNGWVNKHDDRGCPDGYVSTASIPSLFVDLNGDGTICTKTSGNSGANYIDNISNH